MLLPLIGTICLLAFSPVVYRWIRDESQQEPANPSFECLYTEWVAEQRRRTGGY